MELNIIVKGCCILFFGGEVLQQPFRCVIMHARDIRLLARAYVLRDNDEERVGVKMHARDGDEQLKINVSFQKRMILQEFLWRKKERKR